MSQSIHLHLESEKACMKVMPPLAVEPLAQEEYMRWNTNDDGIVSNPEGRCAPDHHIKQHALFNH